MKKVIVLLSLVLAGFVGYAAAGPYLTLSEIKQGVIDSDSETLSDNIEFPTLRQNLKDQLGASLMTNAAEAVKDNPFAALFAGFATQMVDGLVESFVTPAGLAMMMEGRKPPESATTGIGEGDTGAPAKPDDLFKNARYSYDSMSKFSVWVPNEEGRETGFILKREGLSWKLVNLVIPVENNPEQGT